MSDKMMSEFERWADGKHNLNKTSYGAYRSIATQYAYAAWIESWRASRAALVVEFFAFNDFRKKVKGRRPSFLNHAKDWETGIFTISECKAARDYQERPQTQQNAPTIAQDASNKYSRQIVGLDGKTCQIDVYRVLAAFEVDSHPVAHAIKKLLAPGKRHAKTREQDLKEAIASIEAELLMMEQSNE